VLATAAVASAFAAGCGDAVIVIADRAPRPYVIGAPRLVAGLSDGSKNDNPTLTDDLLEIVFSSDRSGDGDVWTARRDAPDLPFGAAVAVTAVNSPSFETSPALSADGLTLWFASDRAGGLGDLDIWVSTRPTRADPWAAPLPVPALSSTFKDVPRPLGQNQTMMPMASERDAPGAYQTYLAPRAESGAFGAPVLITDLSFAGAGATTVDGFLTDDGLTLFFTSAGPGTATTPGTPGDLLVAWRKSITQPFSAVLPLADVDTPAGDERDPWLSPDGTELFFSSDRSGHLDIYVAPVTRQGPTASP